MSTAPGLLTNLRGGVLELRINRPESRNALNGETIQAMTVALDCAGRDPEVRAVLLTGEGRAFCSGGDLKSIFTSHEPTHIRRFLDLNTRPMIRSLQILDKPILAAINGVVAGAGIPLALAADLVIASDQARLVMGYGKIGTMPDSGALYFLAQSLGLSRARELVLLDQTLTAARALELGLYHRVVPDAELPVAARALAEQLAAGPTLAMGLSKKALRESLRLSFDAFMEVEALSMALLVGSEDQREGIAAFNEKRQPRFRGR
jgi:2-(1,2-epoxy-1,2-dihydrophenyl)acetyl-CoA isomerase